jgi:GT2 family glycosyltransferase
MIDISIVIVNWNSTEYLRECIKSLKKHTKDLSYEIIVIDNNSNDFNPDEFRSEFPDIRIVTNKDNLGYVKAANQGAALARGNYLVLLNPDTLFIDNSLYKMKKVLDDNPDIAVVGCKVLDKNLKVSGCSILPLPSLKDRILRRLDLKKPKDYYEQSRYVSGVSGCCFMTRKALINKVGLFDENIVAYNDEVEFFLRIKKLGYKVFYLAETSIIHFGGGSYSLVPLQQEIDERKSRLYVVKKHYSKRIYLAWLLFEIINLTLRSILTGILSLLPGPTKLQRRENFKRKIKVLYEILKATCLTSNH